MFGTALDFAYLLQHELQDILGKKVPTKMFTDSKSLFDLVTNTSYTAEKYLMIDVTCIRDEFKLGDIDDIGHILSQHNAAESSRKVSAGTLHTIMETGSLSHPVQPWIIEKKEVSTHE